MKKYTVWGVSVIIVLVLVLFFNKSVDSFLKESLNDMDSYVTDTVPNEYLLLFTDQQQKEMKVLSATYQKGTHPVCVFEYNNEYEIIMLKMDIDTSKVSLENLLKIVRPLKHNTLNSRLYNIFEGFVNVRIAGNFNKTLVDNVTITMSKEGKYRIGASRGNTLGYIISNCKSFNLFFGEEKNPAIDVELSNRLFGRSNTNIGLYLKQRGSAVFFLFFLPKGEDTEPITAELIHSVI